MQGLEMSIEVVEVRQQDVALLVEKFKAASQKICMMFATEGVYRKPYVEGLPHFQACSYEKMQEIVTSITFFKELCEEQIAEGYKLKDNSSFVWRAFRKLDFIPRADVFNHMTDENLVEIYSVDNKQLYRNFKFFECCSYTLEELYSVEWWNLYERNAAMTMKIFDLGVKVATGEIPDSHVPDIEPHLLKEVKEDGQSFMQQVKLISPLKRNKRVEGLLVIETAEPVHN
ncbi:hypothetical protein AZI87_00125 [Bdellovibrio bacteriovorus]|uniref:Uncharacterized protein n=2 Tax=Bdellovibrio bacteriovorus TaxID=959 RepID=A0A162GBG5_BDEBC|nr:hypothetical protein AZI87_00125 [Bdellovibrio bacteriovorus]